MAELVDAATCEVADRKVVRVELAQGVCGRSLRCASIPSPSTGNWLIDTKCRRSILQMLRRLRVGAVTFPGAAPLSLMSQIVISRTSPGAPNYGKPGHAPVRTTTCRAAQNGRPSRVPRKCLLSTSYRST